MRHLPGARSSRGLGLLRDSDGFQMQARHDTKPPGDARMRNGERRRDTFHASPPRPRENVSAPAR